MRDGGEGVKRHKGTHEDKEVLGGSGLRGGSGETLLLGMCWTHCLCLYRMRMLAQSVSPKMKYQGMIAVLINRL